MKKTVLLSVLALSLFVGTSAYAIEGQTPDNRIKPSSNEAWRKEQAENRDAFKEKQDQLKNDLKEKRQVVKTDIKESREELKTDLKERRAALESELKTRREALQKLLKDKRESLKGEIDKIKKERATIRKGYVENKLRQVVKVIEERQGKIKIAIDRLKTSGVDTTIAEKSLKDSQASLQKAVEALGKMAALVVDDADKVKLEEARKYAKTAEAELKASREHLLLAIKALKDASEDKDDDDKDDDDKSTNVSGSTNTTISVN